MRLLPLVLIAASAHAANFTVNQIFVETYWRTGTSGSFDSRSFFTTSGYHQATNNGVTGVHYISSSNIHSVALADGSQTGYWKQYSWITLSVAETTTVRFSGNLFAPVVEGSDYQYAYVANMDDNFTHIYAAGGLPLNLTLAGPFTYDTFITLEAGTNYAFETSTSWMSASEAAVSGGLHTFGIDFSPVPEPSTYGLILGALALAGAAVRRRKTSK